MALYDLHVNATEEFGSMWKKGWGDTNGEGIVRCVHSPKDAEIYFVLAHSMQLLILGLVTLLSDSNVEILRTCFGLSDSACSSLRPLTIYAHSRLILPHL